MMLIIRLIIRAAHIIAAATWVGGSMMYLLVVMPALKLGNAAPAVAARIADLFRRMVNICVGVLLLSGAFLTFDRLTETSLGLSYIVILTLKILGALGLFVLAIYLGQSNIRRLAKHSTRLSKAAPKLMLVLGIIVFLLGALLNVLFDVMLMPH
ncbi:MAG TPA: hypothetical protein VFN23_12840 [Ktedonobacteraceae bacterium]|nr:hypothetical protein [Ktedonobacteraceae bacterium]